VIRLKKILIILSIMSILILSGCEDIADGESKDDYCESIGYEDAYWASRDKCGSKYPCGSFFCSRPGCNNTVEVSEVFTLIPKTDCNNNNNCNKCSQTC
jgi:hypothetical protein